jgi:hypothetical protein
MMKTATGLDHPDHHGQLSLLAVTGVLMFFHIDSGLNEPCTSG